MRTAFTRRAAPADALAQDAAAVAATCHAMAVRFHRGGRLITFGNGSAAADAAHVAVEFVHPVIMGKRALPAIALSNDPVALSGVASRSGFADSFLPQLRALARPEDIALGISADGRCANVTRALAHASDAGLLTVALVGGDGGDIARLPGIDHVLTVWSADPRVVKEVQVTTYHVLWELVHVFLQQPGVLT